MSNSSILIIASYPDSILAFRGPLISALVSHGMTVYLAAPELLKCTQVVEELQALDVIPIDLSLSRTGMNPLRDIVSILQLTKLMSKISPDIVLSYTVKPVIYGNFAAALAGVPRRFALITGLGFAFTEGELNSTRTLVKRITQRLYKISLNKATGVFFQNQDDCELFQQLGILSENSKIVTLNGSGIDLVRFQKTPLPQMQLSFLMIARLLGDKGVREYAEAARSIRSLYPDIQFHLVGWIDDNPDAIRANELDSWMANGIVFHGKLEDVRPIIANTSVYVLPSYREGTPRTVLEAMAMGRPIITTDAAGCRETVIDGVNGFLVPVKNAQALAEAMIRFIENPDLIPVMGVCSRTIAEEKYDVHKVNAVMLREMGIIGSLNSVINL